ncbi:MAG: VOC family protein [Planctomycetota bacterium]|nr:VOC family protein [Planctomycetota bacterium]
MTLNHVHLGTKDLAQSQQFYERFFGFKKKFDHGAGVFLEDSRGFLIAIDPVDSPHEFPAWFHLGFCLDNKEQVRAIYDTMKSADVSFVKEYQEYGEDAAAFYALDPDGVRIEVSWHKDE